MVSNKFCIPSKVSSNFFLSSSSFISSNNLAVSPNSEVLRTEPITENNINCKYFHIVSFVLSLILSIHNCLKTIPGKNSVLTSESSLNMSTFLYNISKKRSGIIFTQCLKTNKVSFFFDSSPLLDGLFHHLDIRPEYSGKVITISDIKSLIIL